MKNILNFGKKIPFLKDGPRKISKNSSEFHCIEIVKKFDYENFLSTLFIKNDSLRRTAFALRAFNVEISQIRDLTKTNETAQLRFQFWSDIIDDICNNNNNNDNLHQYRNFPVAQELQTIFHDNNISKHWLKKIISVRQEKKNFGNFPFQTMDELEEYCQSTVSSIYYLLNERTIQLTENLAKQTPGYRISLDHIASHFGKAQGLCNILRGIAHNSKFRRCYVPNEILAQTNCTHEDFLRANVNDKTQEAIYQIASKANGHFEKSMNLIKSTQNIGNDRQIYLSHVPMRDYFENLQSSNFNPFDSRHLKRNGFIVLKLWFYSK